MEAIFVDTQIIIFYKDPFGLSYNDSTMNLLNQNSTEVIEHLKSIGIKAYTTLMVASEYYKHLQVNSYRKYKTAKGHKEIDKFDSDDFKNLRDTNIDFMIQWNILMKQFIRIFSKNFKLYDKEFDTEYIIKNFNGEQLDFGDHLLYQHMKSEGKNYYILSNDIDFYNLPDDFYLLTLNNKIISKARTEKKLTK